ncbi:ABC transporter permease [Campylobacter geochelonis]|uniref:Lipoprotein release system transmembrane protein n=1 Tax=Campylobacter geochelonis TaxID=1780362 RepID=A0A128EQ22_9BACT|nr:ABC transporter permease [Campylobacter geochelonis]QKF71507.1 lipoprotein releasing system, transmembrane protein, LolC/E family [Campylobacter geochelonis]CZE47915.1 lipoprotein release system transmembrane protein [Campylobacter geochelonis]CZE48450.1 lipoprotein release system transmembrane protein [Campylobacter geochelonis]CZE50809.1 lipoprotein release system transmembrane protein [Campylobacter geochelonis]
MIKYLVSKYLRFDKSQPFITLCAILAFLGVSIGLMVLIIAMAIMNGFDKEFERKLFTMNYPITIMSHFKGSITKDELATLKAQFPDIKFSPYISSQVIVKSANRLEGGMIFGVNIADEKEINSVVKDGIKDANLSGYGVMLGKGLKDEFLLSDGEKVTLIFTKNDPGGFALIPKMKRFELRADFTSGLIAYDKAYIYADINDLARVLGYSDGKFDGIHIYSKEPFSDIKRISEVLPQGMRAIGWWEQNGNFFSALKLEKRALFIVLMLIILVASLNIISSLLMTVMNRRQEIALLLSLGTSKKEIKKIFFTLGMVIGGGGIVFGLVLGLFGVWLLGSFDIVNLPADVYGSSKLPMELSLTDLVMIVVGALFIVLLSSYYPAKKATQIDVLQTLRNE